MQLTLIQALAVVIAWSGARYSRDGFSSLRLPRAVVETDSRGSPDACQSIGLGRTWGRPIASPLIYKRDLDERDRARRDNA